MAQSVKAIGLEGQEELIKKLRDMGEAVRGKQIERLFLRAGKKMRNTIRELTPVGPTGNLQRSIVARTMSKRGRKAAPAMVAVDFKIGPHAHLLEFGTVKMSPRPFFRPGVIATQDAVGKMIAKGFVRILEKIAKQRGR